MWEPVTEIHFAHAVGANTHVVGHTCKSTCTSLEYCAALRCLPSSMNLHVQQERGRSLTHIQMHTHTHTQTNQEGALGVEGVGAAHVDASVAQEFQQTDVVVTVDLQGETNARK